MKPTLETQASANYKDLAQISLGKNTGFLPTHCTETAFVRVAINFERATDHGFHDSSYCMLNNICSTMDRDSAVVQHRVWFSAVKLGADGFTHYSR